MCWQPLSLKDPDNQGLLAAVANERALRRNKVHMSSVHQRSPVEEYEFHRVILFHAIHASSVILQCVHLNCSWASSGCSFLKAQPGLLIDSALL
jgi:hypothetical protein